MKGTPIQATLPLHIQLTGCAKKFQSEWIFKDLNLELAPAAKLVILGGNGSGKSTLLQCISTAIALNKGSITYTSGQQTISREEVQRYISLASPYLQLIEEFTLPELLDHVAPFKPFIHQMDVEAVMEQIALPNVKQKYIRQYSSGMKQRVKLALAILADCPVLLLDEPVSNLDKNAIRWFQELMQRYTTAKTVIVCSNSIEAEYAGIERFLEMEMYKK